MALGETQKTKVRLYLGWERGYNLNSKLEDRLTNMSATEETEVLSVLTRIAAVETAIDSMMTDQTYATLRVDEVEFRGSDPLETATKHGQRLVQRLTSIIGVECNWGKEAFGDGTGPASSTFSVG